MSEQLSNQLRRDETGPFKLEIVKQKVRRYCERTGFPDSTAAIRGHLKDLLGKTDEALHLPVLFSGCNNNGSLGDFRQDALPGADVDSWTILISGEPSEKSKLVSWLKENSHQALVDASISEEQILTVSELKPFQNLPYQEAIELYGQQGDRAIIWGVMLVEQMRSGTKLFRSPGLEELALEKSKLFQSLPQETNGETKEKAVVREKLRPSFNKLNPMEQYVLIRTHRIFTERLSFSLLSVEPYGEILESLAEEELFERQPAGPFIRYWPRWVA